MPSTTFVILESGRWIESRLRRAAGDLPVCVRAARSLEELSLRLATAPMTTAIIEQGSTEMLEAVRLANRLASAVFVLSEEEVSRTDAQLARLAGAAGLLRANLTMEQWRAWVRQVVTENQKKLSAADGSARK
jgi:hypothetical protein